MPSPGGPDAVCPDLSRLLTPGARYADQHDEYVIEPPPLGDVMFPSARWSGWGDGAYPTFAGYAAPGEVSSFVTDFMVVPAG